MFGLFGGKNKFVKAVGDEILKIMGHHSKEIEKILGYFAKSEVIHKDDMVEV